jgi:hypothetical protein
MGVGLIGLGDLGVERWRQRALCLLEEDVGLASSGPPTMGLEARSSRGDSSIST